MNIQPEEGVAVSSLSLNQVPRTLADNIVLQTPLSRFGKGPGLLILVPDAYQPGHDNDTGTTTAVDPPPLKKWAEEGFAVVQVRVGSLDPTQDCKRGIDALRNLPECAVYYNIGVIVYTLDLDHNSSLIQDLWSFIWRVPEIWAIVTFTEYHVGPPQTDEVTDQVLLVIHRTRPATSPRAENVVYTYDGAISPNFVLPGHEHYQPGPASLAHTRSLQFLRKRLGGPNFDLESIWDEHTMFEFGQRDVDKTMGTMVDEPYVNHVPTMTGGVGRAALTAFYRDHFIFNNPEDTRIELVSRTVGVDRVIDEFIFSLTHDKVVDWLIPGIPPTHKRIRVPFTSVVNIRGDRLYHEHIAWDQATVLRQLGLLPEYLPFPYPLPDGRLPAKGKRFEYRVPAAGVDTARKLMDKSSVKSNEMFGFEIREVDDSR